MRECRLECSRRSAAVMFRGLGPEESKLGEAGGTAISNEEADPGVNGRKTSVSWSSISGFKERCASRAALRSASARTLAACWAASMLALFGESGMESGARSLDRLRAWPIPAVKAFPVATTASFSHSGTPFRRGDEDDELSEVLEAWECRSGWSELAEDGDGDRDGVNPRGGLLSVSHSLTRDLTLVIASIRASTASTVGPSAR
jgi:hypothetical protein